MSYTPAKDYIKDWQWRRKLKVIKERDGNKCRVCHSKKKLNVHHWFYFEERNRPDNYPDESFITLCRDCHLRLHKCHEVSIYSKYPPTYQGWQTMCEDIMKIERKEIEKFFKFFRGVYKKIPL